MRTEKLKEFHQIRKSSRDYSFNHRELKGYVGNSRGYHTEESGIVLHKESTKR